jgi:hypothetical protein
MPVTCQECGQQLLSNATKHTYNDCGQYHLKRAQEILGFSFESMSNEIKNLSDRLYAEQSDVLESDAKITKAFEILDTMQPIPENANQKKDLENFVDRLRECFVTENTKEAKQ